MDNGIYVTLARQMSLFRDMDVTANNIANANTTGYNSEHILFNSYLSKDVNQGVTNPMSFTDNISTYRNTENGSLSVTGNDLDVAITGDGYFTVDTPLGTRYTRAGNFRIDGGGTLVTPEGYPVLDSTGQPFLLPENTTTIEIGSAGNMKVNGEDFGALGVVQFENPQLLQRLSDRLYASDISPDPATNYTVAQGTLESSNVQPVKELTRMIGISNSVSTTAKFIEVMYDLQRKASNTWAQQGNS
jgi:flagellar basal-body rod protein FlgF